ncbi:MAG: 2,3-bisphosphoglycerate-dependent phosphoglycerate mutase [Bdellovibrionales bacterium]|nr:2,3-bisphosphoglycerate-dependent phosphoglycerate mutase [Bdellovibrionales bacterium]
MLVLVRHGQSLWNAENRFTGWEDIDLSPKGEAEARKAGKTLIKNNLKFDCAYTSILTRAIRTLEIILKEMDEVLPTTKSWRLNERHYGRLQGLNKEETALKYGKDQVYSWRRSYSLAPPPMTEQDLEKLSQKEMFQNISVPNGESLEQTYNRVFPLWEESIQPKLKEGKNILISAHGNSLRALIKHIQKMSDEDIVSFEVPTAQPIYIAWKNFKEMPEKFEFL